MKKLKLHLLLIFSFLCAFPSIAQSEPFLTQQWILPTLLNPANAGESDYLRIRGAGRLQWLKTEDYTKYFIGTADMPLELFGKKIGAGIAFYNRKEGLKSNLSASLQANYKLKLGAGVLSAGVQIGYFNTKYNGEDFKEVNEDETSPSDSLLYDNLSGKAIDMAIGVSYNHPHFHIGLSINNLTGKKILMKPSGVETEDLSSYMEYKLRRSLYFDVDGNIPLSNTLFTLQPSLSFLYDFSDYYTQMGLRTTYKRFLNFGVSYRLKESIGLNIGAEFKNIFIGYAYDLPIAGKAKGSSGSHEIVIGYNIKLNYSSKPNYSQKSVRIM